MRSWLRILVTAVALSALAGCGSVSWVHALSTTPDGSRVDVVGAQFQMTMYGPAADQPMRWICLRDGSGRLHCQADPRPLQEMP